MLGSREAPAAEREDGLVDYNVYVMKKKERIGYIALAAAVLFGLGLLFYHNPVLAAILALLGFLFPKYRTRQIIDKRKQALNLQFKDLLYALSSSMTAGRALETAFKDALRDLEVLYPDPGTPIMAELTHMVRCLEMNETVEYAVSQFAERSHIDDIENFADILRTCKRSGGNLVEVIRSTSDMIGDKIETKNEIETLITAKKFETRILMVTPVAMVAILSASSAEYMEPVFRTVVGNIAMTVAILLFVLASVIAEKIMKIEV